MERYRQPWSVIRSTLHDEFSFGVIKKIAGYRPSLDITMSMPTKCLSQNLGAAIGDDRASKVK